MPGSKDKRFPLSRSVIGFVLCTVFATVVIDVQPARATTAQTPTDIEQVPELDNGFRLLYELKFVEARVQFEMWQKANPRGALGYASEAASYLFEECHRQGILTSDFFLDDKRFLGKTPLKPDPDLQAAFLASNKRTQELAQLRLKANPDNANALFAMSMSLGMEANYASLIDKRQLDSLKKTREAETYSKKLLKVAPDAADAYLGLGMANYVIGSLPGPKKFFLGFAGIHGDKKKGVEQLKITAMNGHYLRPFAKVLVALTALREKKPEVARMQFTELVAEFPENPLFASELAKLSPARAAAMPKARILYAISLPALSRCYKHDGTIQEGLLLPDGRLLNDC